MLKLPHLNMLVNWDIGHKFHPPPPPPPPKHNTHYKPQVDQGVVRGDWPLSFSVKSFIIFKEFVYFGGRFKIINSPHRRSVRGFCHLSLISIA